jgi:hypothetical protein
MSDSIVSGQRRSDFQTVSVLINSGLSLSRLFCNGMQRLNEWERRDGPKSHFPKSSVTKDC